MKTIIHYRIGEKIISIFIIILFLGQSYAVSDLQSNGDNTAGNYTESSLSTVNGQILFSPIDSTITYLVDCVTGEVNHTWVSLYLPGVAVYWLGDGMILRTIRIGIGPGTGGGGGGIQKIAWDGSVVWDFRYNTNGCLSHHDVKVLPNGNILMIAWETKTRAEAIAAGRNPATIPVDAFYPDHIIEVQPTGPTSGLIVWEWHVWDHLIQDYDASKENYGVVGDHPELVDINYDVSCPLGDWLHTNSIDYNEAFDQIMISVCFFNEIWVIDHSTTTAEAAGHTGGTSGKGGDLLYRWGNPAAYRKGTIYNQKFFGQHDASWIDKGTPGAGHILVFNNGVERPDGIYSSIDEIAPPVNEHGVYYRASDSAFGPPSQTYIYKMNPPTSFYADIMSGAERLRNNNILVACGSRLAGIFEMTTAGEKVWEFRNTSIPTRNFFKIDYLPSEQETENRPPDTPRFPDPPDHTSEIDRHFVLSWECSDPDDDSLTFDVSFGSSNPPPKVMGNQTNFFYDPGTLTYSTTYYWKIVAWDSKGLCTEGPIWSFSTHTDFSNLPPNIPSNPTPPHHATHIEVDSNISWIGGDPNVGDQVTYDIYFGDEFLPLQKIASNLSNTSMNPGALWYNSTYQWYVVAWDNHGLSTIGPTWLFSTLVTPNNPPEKPTQPSGQLKGKIGQEYMYTTSTSDPEEDKVFYLWDWGDGNTSEWLGPYQSGTTTSMNHNWPVQGSYSIRVKAKDTFEHETSWSDPLPITMPYTYNPMQQFFKQMFQRFPNAFLLLRQLMGY